MTVYSQWKTYSHNMVSTMLLLVTLLTFHATTRHDVDDDDHKITTRTTNPNAQNARAPTAALFALCQKAFRLVPKPKNEQI